ncbi:hypothetical protein L210DRAFT_3529126 [Boletus edulis BED1]|uniref:Uncharacterized protein n=1 Tax=Boletus edulis BED1 TaxID=1328754 RepID=A0AAD4GJM0_BOLED|nr:hypothetical protein L210DRAFT_3529126 [Boletus edulis BED1]
MLLFGSPIPSICITPAPPEEIRPDPYSPFSSEILDVEDDEYRTNRLSLPPLPPWQSSSLRPASRLRQGLTQYQFISLLKVSRHQRAKFGLQKVPDLRKELALKSQALKQLDRRARFLSKLGGPSTVTLSIPEVPPSCCGFKPEYSPLEIAAEISEDSVVVNSPNPAWDKWVECAPLIAEQPLASSTFPPAMPLRKSSRIPPSLDEITARLKPVHVSSKRDCSPSRLPTFLKASSMSPASTDHQIKTLPVRLALNDETCDTSLNQQVIHPERSGPCTLTRESRRTVFFHTVDVAAGPTLHTTRADTARDMIVTLGRRNSPPPDLGRHECTRTSTEVKRWSASAHSGRVGFGCAVVSRYGL